MDRLYSDYSVIGYCLQPQSHFFIRCPLRQNFVVVSEFAQNPTVKDQLVTLHRTARAEKSEPGLPPQITVR